MDRLAYADANRGRYLAWCADVASGPATVADRFEFAVISAHCPFGKAIAAWKATRGIDRVLEYGAALHTAGVVGPFNKAARALEIRDGLASGELPEPRADFRDWRRRYKFRGLGFCKASFAACLCKPFESDIVCLDTHVLRALAGEEADARFIRRTWENRGDYEYWESVLVLEAEELQMPAFAYQWAVWDWQRARAMQVPPSNHSVFWKGGESQYQLPLFTHLED